MNTRTGLTIGCTAAAAAMLAAIVLLAVAAVIVFLNADGDDPALSDNAVTTQEERLDTDLDSTAGEDAMATPTGEEGGEDTPAE